MPHGSAYVLILGIVILVVCAIYRIKAHSIAMKTRYPETMRTNIVVSSTLGGFIGLVISLVGAAVFIAPALPTS